MTSIIVPIYNASISLDRCLKSISSQQYKDWECILVDDGSADDSLSICEKWARSDARFVVMSQANGGVSVARNTALGMARGEWVTFIDADDWIDEDYLANMIDNCEGADLVVSGQLREFEEKQVTYKPERTEAWTLDCQHAIEFNKLNESFLLYAPHEKMFRTDIIRRYALMFEAGCSYGEDLQFVYAYLEHVKVVSMVAVAKYHYKMGDGESLSTVFREDQFVVDYKQWKIVHDFYVNHEMMTRDGDVYLYRRLWGIVYDGLFLVTKMYKVQWSYIRKILSIPEVEHMREMKDVFSCASWIKFAVVNRMTFLMYLYFRFFAGKR